MKKKKNRLSNIIKWELICLAAVTVFVAGLIKWSENKADTPGDHSARQAASGVVKAGEGAGEDESGGNMPSPISAGNFEEQGEQTPAVTGLGVTDAVPTKAPADTALPSPTAGEDVPGREDVTQAPEATFTATPVPTSRPTPTVMAEPTVRPTPTTAPTATPKPTATPQPTATPTPTPSATPVPAGGQTEGMDTDFIASLSAPQSGEILTADGAVDTVYYMQTDSRWGNKFYGGEDTIAKYACGPTSMAIVVSSLTDIGIDPEQMSGWAYNKGYWYPQSGSLHSVVNGTAKAFGLKSEGVGNDSETPEKVKNALKNGDMVVVLMGKGHFTKGGHFIVLRGMTAEGKILVADCNSRENTMTEWDFETIQSEAKWASDGGPFWIIRNPNIMQ